MGASAASQLAASRAALEALVAPLASLAAVEARVGAVGRHVMAVEGAVARLETQLADSTREYNRRALRATLSPLGKLFGVGGAGAEPMPPLARPVPSINTDEAMALIREH